VQTPMSSQPCTGCQAGQMRLRYVTYFTWLDEELVTVPGFPAWICDMCGKREYDPRAVNQLNLLLNPNAGKPTRRKHTPQTPRSTRKGSRPATE